MFPDLLRLSRGTLFNLPEILSPSFILNCEIYNKSYTVGLCDLLYNDILLVFVVLYMMVKRTTSYDSILGQHFRLTS
jgi:hypothetical protein